jgi:hypothetical protein
MVVETIAKIRERTRAAMMRTEVLGKVREGRAKQASKPVEPEVRVSCLADCGVVIELVAWSASQ